MCSYKIKKLIGISSRLNVNLACCSIQHMLIEDKASRSQNMMVEK